MTAKTIVLRQTDHFIAKFKLSERDLMIFNSNDFEYNEVGLVRVFYVWIDQVKVALLFTCKNRSCVTQHGKTNVHLFQILT